MADYKDKKTLDSSVAGEFDICNVGFSENVPFEIENEEVLKLSYWCCRIKNDFFNIPRRS